MSENIKQVIVVRTDLKMRRGKENSQCSHAALAFVGRQIQKHLLALLAHGESLDKMFHVYGKIPVTVNVGKEEAAWFLDIYTKITLAADSEAELFDIKRLAEEAGLQVHLIIDAGLTEIPPNTPTCLAIGPDIASRIDAITGPNGIHPLKLR